jgi:hypothetical protein
MSLNFYDAATGEISSSTRMARRMLDLATHDVDPEMNAKVLAVKNWRKEYRGIFLALTKTEYYQEQNLLEIARIGLAELANSIRDESGKTIGEIVSAGWTGPALVETFIISGTNQPVPLEASKISSLTDAAQIYVHEKVAEPGLVPAFKFLDAHKKLPVTSDLLIALAGSAEYAPTKHWLAIGGTVAVVARPNAKRWLDLIEYARKTGGTLLVPVLKSRVPENAISLSDEAIAQNAGIDICDEAEALAAWVAALAVVRKERIVLGQYAYAPGTQHILVQAVQDSLANIICQKLPATKVALAWLATPADSTAVPAEVLQDSLTRYAGRSSAVKLRDFILGMKKTNGEFFENRFGEKLALIDPTSGKQGSSYALAKRTQRWRAYLANSQGVKVSYLVSPPARTYSVLSHRVLNATYRGAPRFGLLPFTVEDATVATTAMLLKDLHGPMPQRGSTALHTDAAIHGGLWRLIYSPKSVWTRSTVLGWLGLFSKRTKP